MVRVSLAAKNNDITCKHESPSDPVINAVDPQIASKGGLYTGFRSAFRLYWQSAGVLE